MHVFSGGARTRSKAVSLQGPFSEDALSGGEVVPLE